jgi:thiol-disulfide isomerase/thioredoxin
MFLGLFILMIAVFAKAGYGQDSIPAHLKNLRLPDFKLLLPDSSTNFYTENLKPNRITIVISFSPECEHCQKQTKEIIAQIDRFKQVQIVMATTLPFEKMKAFYKEYKIGSYKNIIMGRDILFFFPKYYRNHYLPLIAVYNEKAQLIHYADGGVSTAELIRWISE